MGYAKLLPINGPAGPGPTNAAQNLNSANSWAAFGWIQPFTDTITEIVHNAQAIAGTQANLKTSCAIYSSVNGAPGAALTSWVEVTNTPAGPLVFSFGAGLSVTQDTAYFEVYKNTAAAPATDYVTLRQVTAIFGGRIPNGGTAMPQNAYWTSANGGSTWSQGLNGTGYLRHNHVTNGYSGCPLFSRVTDTSLVYGNNYFGIKRTSPAGGMRKIYGITVAYGGKTGTPTGNLFAKAYIGTAAAVNSATAIAPASFATSTSGFTIWWATPLSIPPSTVYRYMLCNSAADAAANAYTNWETASIHNDANSKTLIPLSSMKTVSADGGSTFTDTDTSLPMITEITDAADAFVAPTFPANAQVINTLASWGFNGEYGPGEVDTSVSSASFSSCSDSSASFSESSASYADPSVSSQSSRSQSSDSQSSRSNLSGSSSSQSSRSDSSDSSSFMITAGSDSIQAQITANIKAALKTITIANGYNYDVARVEELRKIQEMNDNLPFVLLIEGDPQKDSEDSCVIRTLNYQVWYFPKDDDRVTGDNAADEDTEITYTHRNIMADVAKALCVDPYRGIVDGATSARAENTLVDPGYPEMYLNETLMLPGFYCDVRVITNIDVTNPYQLRQGA